MENFKTSGFVSLINFNLGYIIRPIRVQIERNRKLRITIKRRNWHFISSDETVLEANTVNSVVVNTHLFGSTISYKAWGSKAKIKHLKKKDAKAIQKSILNN